MALPVPDRFLQGTPRYGVPLLLAAVLGLVLVGRGAPPAPEARPAPVAERELIFADGADGSVAVTDARTGAPVGAIEPGTNGFVRGAMRGLMRERKLDGLGRDLPFRLAAWPDGAFTLEDTATRRVIDLRAFGETNAEAFARLLSARETTP